MKVYREVTDVFDFDFWGNAAYTVSHLTNREIADIMENYWDEDDIISATELNDFFAFEQDIIAQFLGCDDWDILLRGRE